MSLLKIFYSFEILVTTKILLLPRLNVSLRDLLHVLLKIQLVLIR